MTIQHLLAAQHLLTAQPLLTTQHSLTFSRCFAAILGSPPNMSVGWFLASHKDELTGVGHKMLKSVRVLTTQQDPQEVQLPTLFWEVGDWTEADEERAKTIERFGVAGLDERRLSHAKQGA